MNLLDTVRRTLLEQQLVKPGEKVVMGVSGGPDSLVLLHALRALAPELALQLHIAHLNHQLRGADSDADAEYVMQLAREWGLPAAGAGWDVAGYARQERLSLEEAARILRYQFLAATAAHLGARVVAVGHHADDQVETVLMHFLRGAGLAGLRGMTYASRLPQAEAEQVARQELVLIRPLLDVTRAEIEAYCREHQLQPRLDHTNLDTALFRNKLRHEVIPFLEKLNPNLRTVLRHSAASLADDYDYIHTNVLGIFDRMATRAEGAFVFNGQWFRALPPSLQRGVLREAVMRLRHGLRNIGWVHIETARHTVLADQAGAEATLPQGLLLVVGYGDFTIGESVPLPDLPLLHGDELDLAVDSESALPDTDWQVVVEAHPAELPDSPWAAQFDAERIKGQLQLRTRRAGDRFEPLGMSGHTKSLHEFMIDEKIQRYLRDLIPILADDEKILWVCGYRTDERARVTPETTRVLAVRFSKGIE